MHIDFMPVVSHRFYCQTCLIGFMSVIIPFGGFWMERAIQASTFLELGTPSFGGYYNPKIYHNPKKYCRGLDREVPGSTNYHIYIYIYIYNIQQPSNLIRWGCPKPI